MRDDSEDALGVFGDALGLFRGDLASSWSALAASSEGCLRRALGVLWGTLGIVWGCSRGCLLNPFCGNLAVFPRTGLAPEGVLTDAPGSVVSCPHPPVAA